MRKDTPKAAIALLSAAAFLLVTGCSGTVGAPQAESSDAPVTITYVAYGGAGQESQTAAWQEPYTALNPQVTFLNTSPADVAQVKAQVEAGAVQWDVMAIAPYAAEQNCGVLFEELDVPGADTDNLPSEAIGKCYIGNFLVGPILGYRAEAFPDGGAAPKTIADFFDLQKFPGKRGVVASIQDGILEYPLLAEGVSPDDLYPIDVDRALGKWDTIRGETLFAENYGALQQAVASGQVDMFFLIGSRQLALLDEGIDIDQVWDRTVTSVNGLAIPKGSPNKSAVESFLGFVTQPEQQAKMAELGGVSPLNQKSAPQLTAHGKKVDLVGPGNTGILVPQDIQWYAENFNEVRETFTKWLNG